MMKKTTGQGFPSPIPIDCKQGPISENLEAKPDTLLWARKIFLFLSSLVFLLYSCAKDRVDIIREKEVRSTTQEILTFQERPQEKVAEYRWNSLRAYEAFVEAHKGQKGGGMAESMQALADIYMEIEENTYLKRKGKIDHGRSRKLYQEVLRLYPERPENESILYQMARGYMEEGDWESCNTLLEKIVREFPNGRFAQEASFRLGEYYFEYRDRPKAIYYYRQVLKKDDYYLYDRALYKLGWALFQEKDYEGAAERFISLLERKGVRLTPEGKEEIPDLPLSEREMIWDSIKTLILVFDYMGGHTRISEYFKVRGIQGYEPYIYRRLGDIYLESGRFKEAAETYESFIATNPLHEDAPLFQARIVDTYMRGNMFDLAYQARVKLIDTYREGSIWFKSNRRNAQKRALDLVELNRPLVKHDMYQIAKYNYALARRSKKEKDYADAIFHMRRFIDNFPEEPESEELRGMLAEINFLLAELYFEMKEYGSAEAEYEKVAYQYKPSSFSAEAGYGVLLSLEKLARPSGQFSATNPYILKLGEECDRFIRSFPQDRRVPEILLNGAEIYSHLNNFEKSRTMAQLLIQHDLSTDKHRYMAQRLIADSYLKEQAFKKGEEEIRKAIAIIPPEDRKDLPLLEKALAASLYKQAEELKSTGKTIEAAEAFERVFHSVPDTEIAPVALYDAGVLYEEASDLEKAIRVYSTIVYRYPESKYALDASIQWAGIKENLKDYAMAARLFEKAAEIAQDRGSKEEASYKAILMYEAGKDVEALYNRYNKFYEEFPKSPRLIELTYRVAENRASIGDPVTAKTLYERVISLHKESGANATIEESILAAKAQLAIGDYKKNIFEKVKLVHPLEENFKKKEALLKEALAGYTAATKYRIGDISTEATYKMGEMLENFKDAILDSERPKDLSPEQLEEYNFLLEEQAYPFEEKAILAYEGNIKRTIETGIYNQWIQKSYENLARLHPARYKRNEVGERFSGDISVPIPDDPELYNSRGILFREKGEFKKAEEDYLKCLSLKPDFDKAYLNLGILYELYLGRPEDALRSYREYIRLGGKREDVFAWIDIIEKRINSKTQD